MSADTILVERSPGETRTALLAGDSLIAIHHRRDADMQPDTVYRGKAGARVPGVDAIFVDVGDHSPSVLALKPPFPSEGQALTVRVVVPPRVGKGAVLKLADIAASPGVNLPILPPHQVVAWWSRYRDSITRIVCTPQREAARVKDLLGADAPVTVHTGMTDLFAVHGVDEAIEAALRPDVPLKCGGSLIIETTAALTAIDVNSGSADPDAANRDAIDMVAAELCRRNIAGHIVVDIIPTRRKASLPRLLAKAVADDPVPTHIAGLTPLGMIELTRQRLGLSLAETLLDGESALGRLSAASVAYAALRAVVRKARAENLTRISLTAAPDVVAALQEVLHAALKEAQDFIKGEIALQARADFGRDRIDIGSA